MFLYSSLLFVSILIPFILSFDKKLRFYKNWKYLFPSLLLIGMLFILFDVYFTKLGIWGFNTRYTLNITLFGLPLEELLFFVIIPYASIFLHESIILYFPSFRLKKNVSRYLTATLILLSSFIIFLNIDRIYTVYSCGILILTLILSLFDRSAVIQYFYLTFLAILIPFSVVNGILTGCLIDEQVVWYNNYENLGIRLLTIPVEDFTYGFSLILLNLMLTNKLKGIY